MDQNDRDKILNNINRLIEVTDYDLLIDECLNRNILFPQMKEKIEVSIINSRNDSSLQLKFEFVGQQNHTNFVKQKTSINY